MKGHYKRYFIEFARFGLPGWPQTGHLISTISQNQSVPQRLFHKLYLIIIFLLLETKHAVSHVENWVSEQNAGEKEENSLGLPWWSSGWEMPP